MDSTADEVGRYLQQNSIGTMWTDIFIDEVAPKLEHISIFNTGGFATDNTFSHNKIENCSITIQSRFNSRVMAYETLVQIKDLLDGKGNIQVGNHFYLFLKLTSDILYVERDEDNRVCYSMNLTTKRYK